MSDEKHWQALAETAAEWGDRVGGFLLAQAHDLPLDYYDRLNADERIARGEMLVWLGNKVKARYQSEA